MNVFCTLQWPNYYKLRRDICPRVPCHRGCTGGCTDRGIRLIWLVLLVILHSNQQFWDGVKTYQVSRQHYLIFFQYFLYYNNLYKQSISKQRYSQIAGSVTENVTKLSFASERMQAAERSQLRSRLQSSKDFNRHRGAAMSIIVSISADQTHALDIDADEMLNSCRTLSLIPDSVGVDHPCCQKPHGSLRSFSLTGMI